MQSNNVIVNIVALLDVWPSRLWSHAMSRYAHSMRLCPVVLTIIFISRICTFLTFSSPEVQVETRNFSSVCSNILSSISFSQFISLKSTIDFPIFFLLLNDDIDCNAGLCRLTALMTNQLINLKHFDISILMFVRIWTVLSLEWKNSHHFFSIEKSVNYLASRILFGFSFFFKFYLLEEKKI